MGYTLEITDGTTTYTFQVQPEFQRGFSWEYNEKLVPPVLTGEIETWELKNAYFTGAAASVTTDFDTLAAHIRDRTTPITSVKFKRDAATVFELNVSTTHRGGLMVTAFASRGGAGQWENHWQADLVLVGRRMIDDGAGVKSVEKEQSYTYDSNGLTTVRLSGSIETVPGTSAEAKARTMALTSPGAAYGLVTAGPSDQPNVRVHDPETDTRASFESVWKEHGVSLPSGANEWDLASETHELPDGGERVVVTVRAKGPTLSLLRSAVRAEKPGTELAELSEREDEAGLEYAATYTQERSSARTKARWGGAVVYRRMEVSIDGGWTADETDRDLEPVLIPGHPVAFVRRPRGPVTVSERQVARIRGPWASLSDFGLEPRLRGESGLFFQPGEQRGPTVALEKEGFLGDADLWRAEVSYGYVGAEVDAASIANLVRGELSA